MIAYSLDVVVTFFAKPYFVYWTIILSVSVNMVNTKIIFLSLSAPPTLPHGFLHTQTKTPSRYGVLSLRRGDPETGSCLDRRSLCKIPCLNHPEIILLNSTVFVKIFLFKIFQFFGFLWQVYSLPFCFICLHCRCKQTSTAILCSLFSHQIWVMLRPILLVFKVHLSIV